jgi:hypothetical protein
VNEPTTHVSVTPAHIADGIVRSCDRCPVALALIEALGDLFTPDSMVAVDPLSIMFWPDADGDETWKAVTPHAAAAFIVAFDSLDGPGPFEFDLAWRVTKDGGQP